MHAQTAKREGSATMLTSGREASLSMEASGKLEPSMKPGTSSRSSWVSWGREALPLANLDQKSS